jgi:hypothetical protein
MARMSLNLQELHVETFDALPAGLHGDGAKVGTNLGCPPTAYLTCYYSTPRQDEFRITSLCC